MGIFVLRWVLSRSFKKDDNTEYGIYTESGDVMEVVDQNLEYEQQTAASKQSTGKQVSEDKYDKMYQENDYDKMYD